MRARIHHYLPVGYLAGFTPSGCARDRLWVHDLLGGRVWMSLPKKVARQRDLYTVSSGPTRPDLFECELAKRDGEHAKLVRKVCHSRQFPGDSFDDLLGFVALTCMRSPSVRGMMTRWLEQHTGLPFEEAVQDPNNWGWLAEFLGLDPATVHGFVGRYAQGNAKTQLWPVLLIDVLVCLMLPLLKSRQWSLCFSHGEDHVVCSNTPLGIAWPLEHPSDKRPTLGDDAAILTFPFDRHTAFISGLDDHCCVRHVGRSAVAEINTQTVLSLKTHAVQPGFVFASAREFCCMGNEGLLQVTGADFALVEDPAGEG